MFSVISDIKSMFKVSKVGIDNIIFKFHYKMTVIILVIFSILVNTTQYFGDPVDCTQANPEINNIVDTYCWFNSYSLVSDDGEVMLQVRKFKSEDDEKGDTYMNPYTGQKLSDKRGRDNIKYHKVRQSYYQWIGLVLMIQAGFFYFPRFLWKQCWEEGRIRELIDGLSNHIQDQDNFKQREANVLTYMYNNKGRHGFYAFKFFFCELLNFINVIGQIFLTDWFLGHAFLNFGMQWLWYNPEDDPHHILHPTHRYFPKENLCNVYYGSAGGDLPNRYVALCVFPVQVLNEKIYIFLWFYFITLLVISGLSLFYRALTIFSTRFRVYMLKKRAWRSKDKSVKKVGDNLDVGDWFILYQMGKNMDPFVFGKLLGKVSKEIYDGKEDDVTNVRFLSTAPPDNKLNIMDSSDYEKYGLP